MSLPGSGGAFRRFREHLIERAGLGFQGVEPVLEKRHLDRKRPAGERLYREVVLDGVRLGYWYAVKLERAARGEHQILG